MLCSFMNVIAASEAEAVKEGTAAVRAGPFPGTHCVLWT